MRKQLQQAADQQVAVRQRTTRSRAAEAMDGIMMHFLVLTISTHPDSSSGRPVIVAQLYTLHVLGFGTLRCSWQQNLKKKITL